MQENNISPLLMFDIDGTIMRMKDYRSRWIFSDTFYRFFNKRVEPNEMSDFSGKTDLQILSEISKIAGIDLKIVLNRIDEVWADLFDEFKKVTHEDTVVVFPGVRELIEELSQDGEFSLSLLTGNFKENAYLKLSVCNVDEYFPFGAFGSDKLERNHLPDLLIDRAGQHNKSREFSKKHSLIIGDSPMDIRCAKANGIPSLCVSTGGYSCDKLIQLGADYAIEDFSKKQQVISLMREIFAD